MIEAGNETQFEWGDGNWVFLDIGFSGACNARGRTCGLAIGNSEPECVNFAEAKQKIVKHIGDAQSLTNLVIEAPLSVCFSATGLPTGRSIEIKEGQQRYWYTGPGCAVMVASMYMMKAISKTPSPNTVRLFEAFISYKARGAKSDHTGEVKMLRDAVRHPQKLAPRIIAAKNLKLREDDDLQSAFRIMGLGFRRARRHHVLRSRKRAHQRERRRCPIVIAHIAHTQQIRRRRSKTRQAQHP